MYSIKVEIEGELNIHGEPSSIAVETVCSRLNFRYFFGKFLYAIEKMGWNFVTADVYDECMKVYNEYEESCFDEEDEDEDYWRSLYKKVEDDFSMKISIKYEIE